MRALPRLHHVKASRLRRPSAHQGGSIGVRPFSLYNGSMKSQTVRVLDVVAIGPLLIYVGAKHEHKLVGAATVAVGFATIVYNARNYIRASK